MGCFARFIDFVGNALHTIFETAKTLAQPLTEFWKLLAPEQNKHNHCDYDQMCWCKEFAHNQSPRGCANKSPHETIVAHALICKYATARAVDVPSGDIS